MYVHMVDTTWRAGANERNRGRGPEGGSNHKKEKKLDYVLNTRALAADLLCRHLQELI